MRGKEGGDGDLGTEVEGRPPLRKLSVVGWGWGWEWSRAVTGLTVMAAPLRRDGAGLGSGNFPTPAGLSIVVSRGERRKYGKVLGVDNIPTGACPVALITLEQPRTPPEHAVLHYGIV